MQSKIYLGALSEPISVDPTRWPGELGIENLAEREQKYRDLIIGQTVEKFQLLFEHYGIDYTTAHKWEALARALAGDHVPGFQIITSKPKKMESKPAVARKKSRKRPPKSRTRRSRPAKSIPKKTRARK